MKKIIIIIIILLITIFIIRGLDDKIKIRNYYIKDDKAPSFKIALITDFHANKVDLSSYVQNVDIIMLGGDIFDDRKDLNISYDFIKEMAKIKPTFFALGNHELRTRKVDEILNNLKKINNLYVLNGNYNMLNIKGMNVTLLGITDPENNKEEYERQLNNFKEYKARTYSILLAHHPERIDDYKEIDVSLILSGHAHGGIIRIPYILENGLISPNEGFFPKYTGGIHKIGKQKLIISRGIDNETVPVPRFYNNREVVIININ